MITFVYDMKLKRPGCALLQAAYGTTIDNLNLQKMLNHWLLATTDDLQMYRVENQEQLDKVIKITNDFNKIKL